MVLSIANTDNYMLIINYDDTESTNINFNQNTLLSIIVNWGK